MVVTWSSLEKAEEFINTITKRGYSDYRVSRHKNALRKLAKHLHKSGRSTIDESTCFQLASKCLGRRVSSFRATESDIVNSLLRTCKMYLTYIRDGVLCEVVLERKGALKWPEPFLDKCELIVEHLRDEGLAESSICCFKSDFMVFLRFLKLWHITDFNDVTKQTIELFIASKRHCASSYRDRLYRAAKRGLFTLYSVGVLPQDITSGIPHKFRVSVSRMPYAWKVEEVSRLLAAIERSSPIGKRNYAILLLIARLGLRQGDVRDLRLSSINWQKRELSIVTNKTKSCLTLPLLDDIAWALIDYLKNGRPETASDKVFVSHFAPYREFGSMTKLRHMLRMAMRRAGLDLPLDVKQGLHSLRSALARSMLEKGSPLPIVSGVLGHKDMRTTGAYIRLDIKGLARCALDPEEVLQ